MALEEQLLTASIEQTFAEARKAERHLSRLTYLNTQDNVDEGEHADDLREAEGVLEYYVEKTFRDVGILAERLGLPLLAKEIARARAEIKKLSEIDLDPGEMEFHCGPLGEVRKYFDSLECMTRGRAVTGLSVFETILENTPKIIDDAALSPSKEAQVRKEILRILRYSFRDVVREIPFPKNIKVYKPDIGVPSLMAAAEYKFVDSKEEAKKSLDEVYADMRGYGGRYDWRSFYAVFYMTGPFYNQKDVDEEFRLVKAELSWTPIVVVGPGKRKQRPGSLGASSAVSSQSGIKGPSSRVRSGIV
jgi:hypothetical protein